MADLDEVSQAIGRLAALQEAHTSETQQFRRTFCERLDKIEAKVETWEAHRNKVLGASAVLATVFGMISPWLKQKFGL